jgi:protein-tyrosine phosphatase
VPDRRASRGDAGDPIEQSLYLNGTIGLRCPSDPVGVAILREGGVPVAATSANLAGRPPPRTAQEALEDLDGRVAVVVDGGRTAYARPSTVVRVGEGDSYEVLREGAVGERLLERLARTRVLLICSGNVCRSPMAAGFARAMAAERMGCDPAELETHGLVIESAGTATVEGTPASENARRVMAERGIDIEDHRSRPMTVDLLLGSDYIWVMAAEHLAAVRRLAPEVADRAALVDPDGSSVSDPMGGDMAVYEACARRIEQAVARRIEEITG